MLCSDTSARRLREPSVTSKDLPVQTFYRLTAEMLLRTTYLVNCHPSWRSPLQTWSPCEYIIRSLRGNSFNGSLLSLIKALDDPVFSLKECR
ncbi:hypothetical protein R1flu_020853 [Riccia fluitans]|uniref:Uncharacterized protein n=1 Tax=Riccia fluitans TaxID=41844 RepID=A0ABD1ZMP5_9MARC